MAEETQFLALVHKSDISGALLLLNRNQVRPDTCRDARGYSALHIAALNGSFRMASVLIQYVQQRDPDSETTLAAWANARTEEEFAALHFACFKGNLVPFT